MAPRARQSTLMGRSGSGMGYDLVPGTILAHAAWRPPPARDLTYTTTRHPYKGGGGGGRFRGGERPHLSYTCPTPRFHGVGASGWAQFPTLM
jgi:hypothetical protein